MIIYIRVIKIALGFFLAIVAGSNVFAEETNAVDKEKMMNIEGHIKVVGSAYNARSVLIKEEDGNKQQYNFCKDSISKKIGQLSGMMLTVKGHWKEYKGKASKKSKKCFLAQSFQIKEMSSGRKPLVGILNKDASHYSLTDEDGSAHRLDKLTDGLKKLVGKKVIIDVKMLGNGTGGSSYRVVSYALYP
ncbi:MAG: hypothetical protein R3B45_14330 [Bdellovibrionota bacterium]